MVNTEPLFLTNRLQIHCCQQGVLLRDRGQLYQRSCMSYRSAARLNWTHSPSTKADFRWKHGNETKQSESSCVLVTSSAQLCRWNGAERWGTRPLKRTKEKTTSVSICELWARLITTYWMLLESYWLKRQSFIRGLIPLVATPYTQLAKWILAIIAILYSYLN